MKAILNGFALITICTVLLIFLKPAQAMTGFKRGINLNHVMSYPAPTGWPRFSGKQSEISSRELDALKRAGFDHIRLLIDPEIYLQETQKHKTALDQRLKQLIARIHGSGLGVIAVNYTRHTAVEWNPERVFTSKSNPSYLKFKDHISHIALILRNYDPERIRFVLVSEPQKDCFKPDGSDWTIFQQDLYNLARSVAPKLSLGLTGGCWSSIDGLKNVHMDSFDQNTFIDVHFYSPFTFTHQGATWTLPAQRYVAGLQYPSAPGQLEDVRAAIDRMYSANPSGDTKTLTDAYRRAQEYLGYQIKKSTLETYFQRLEKWRIRENVSQSRIAIGEFGALRPSVILGRPSQDSRLAWLKDTREIIESHGFSWSMWDYFPPFSLLDDVDQRTLDRQTLKALGLTD